MESGIKQSFYNLIYNLTSVFDSEPAENIFFYGLTGYLIVYTAWEMYLIYRQIRVYKTTINVPDITKHAFTEEAFERSRSYAIDQAEFRACTTLYMNYLTLMSLYHQGLCFGWDAAKSLAKDWGFNSNNVYAVNFCFAISNCISSINIALPMALYYTFVIEQKHGFNNQTLIPFLVDYIKENVMLTISDISVSSAIIFIVNYDYHHFYIWLWLFSFLMLIADEFITSLILDPWLNEHTSLPDGELRTAVEQLTTSVNFPLSEIYVINEALGPSHSGAYFTTGIVGPRRIVIYENLFQKEKGLLPYENDEILAIICHELGHWQHGHIYRIMMLSQITEFFKYMFLNALLHFSPLYRMFGFAPGVEPTIIGFIIIQGYVLAPFNALMDFIFTNFICHCEMQADDFAVKMNFRQQLKNALIKTNCNNLIFPVEDWLFAMWHIDHPSLIERIDRVDKIKDD